MKKLTYTFLSILLSYSVYAQVNLNDGLVAQYDFSVNDFSNDKIADLSGNGYAVECYNISFFDDDTFLGIQEAVATGYPTTGSYMALNTNNEVSQWQESKNMTFSFWTIRAFNNLTQDFTPILSFMDDNGNGYELDIDNQNNTVRFEYIYDGNIVASINSISNTFYGEWYHISAAINVEESKIALYIDGEFEIESEPIDLQTIYKPTLFFGKKHSGETPIGAVCFDNMYIHERALNIEEIKKTVDLFLTGTEEKTLSASSINIYPNPSPSNNIIHFDLPNQNDLATVDIFNNNGKLLASEIINANSININGLPNGLYLLKIQLKEGIVIKKLSVY